MKHISPGGQARRRAVGRRCATIAKELEEIGAIRLDTQVEGDLQYLSEKEKHNVNVIAKNALTVASHLQKLAGKLDK